MLFQVTCFISYINLTCICSCFSNENVWHPWCTDRRRLIASRSSMLEESSRYSSCCFANYIVHIITLYLTGSNPKVNTILKVVVNIYNIYSMFSTHFMNCSLTHFFGSVLSKISDGDYVIPVAHRIKLVNYLCV